MIKITKHTNYFRCCIEPHFYTLSFCSGWWNRTTDLLGMNQTSYHFSDPHQFLIDYILRLFIYMSQRFFYFYQCNQVFIVYLSLLIGLCPLCKCVYPAGCITNVPVLGFIFNF